MDPKSGATSTELLDDELLSKFSSETIGLNFEEILQLSMNSHTGWPRFGTGRRICSLDGLFIARQPVL